MAISIFERAADATPRERDLMRGIPENDLIQHMMAKVKLSAPNLERTKTATRKRPPRPAPEAALAAAAAADV